MNHRIQYYLALPIISLIERIPPAWARFVSRRAADIIYLIASERRKTGMANLRRAFGDSLPDRELKRLLRKSFHSMGMSMTDLFIVEKVRREAEKRFTIQGLEHYEEALRENRGVVLVTSHLGSWEYLAFLFYLTNTQCSVVVKEIRNPWFDRYVTRARQRTGLIPVPKIKSMPTVLRELKKNNTVAILIDQWAGDQGIWQEFFGEPTSTTSVPARLAQRTGCALLPAFCLRTGEGQYVIEIRKPVFAQEFPEPSEAAITKHLSETLEGMIRLHPEQWSWAHRRWKSKPAATREPV